MRWLGLAGGMLLLAVPSLAHDYAVGTLTVAHPYAIATAAGARTGAGYLSVTNAGSEPERLLAVEADFPRVEVHTTEIDPAGVARMAPVEGVEIAPGSTVTLAPQGTHVMFMGLTAPFVEGTRVPAVLVFEKAGRLPVEFAVEARTTDAGTGPASEHGGH